MTIGRKSYAENEMSRFPPFKLASPAFVSDAKAWTGRGGGGGIRESTGRDLGYLP